MTKPEKKTLFRSMLFSAALLSVFAAVGGGLVALTEQLTRERITDNERRATLSTLQDILPAEQYDNDLVSDTVALESVSGLNVESPVLVHRARLGNEPVAALFPVIAPDGYSGPIHLLMGVYVDGTVAGVRVTKHSETPGLGDPIEVRRSDWIHDFEGRTLGDPPESQWAVKADDGVFDQFTGATITPRAVVGAVRRGLIYFERNRERIFPDHDQEKLPVNNAQ